MRIFGYRSYLPGGWWLVIQRVAIGGTNFHPGKGATEIVRNARIWRSSHSSALQKLSRSGAAEVTGFRRPGRRPRRKFRLESGRFDHLNHARARYRSNSFNCLRMSTNGQVIARALKEPPPMWSHERRKSGQRKWVVIFSYGVSLAASAAIWTGVFRAVQYLVK